MRATSVLIHALSADFNMHGEWLPAHAQVKIYYQPVGCPSGPPTVVHATTMSELLEALSELALCAPSGEVIIEEAS